jgi:acyl-CoA synthetase (AMP-forming)/AMP-acid ligase II
MTATRPERVSHWGELDPAALATIVRWASHAPRQAAACRAWLASPSELSSIPPMDIEDLLAANRAWLRGSAAYYFCSGGTTSQPKLALQAGHLGVDRILRSWAPLRSTDVLANLFMPGRLWGAHYFYNAVAERAGARALALGRLGPREVAEWLPTLIGCEVTALAGTPTTLAELTQASLEHDVRLAPRMAIWVGEPLPAATVALLRELNPDIELWGNYGSIETWVVASNGPACPPATMHLLPGQFVELAAGGTALVTRTVEGASTPLLRYRMGDRLTAAACRCGADLPAVTVGGRADDAVKLGGALLWIGDLLRSALCLPNVVAAQVLLEPLSPSAPQGVQRRVGLKVRMRDGGERTAEVRDHMLREFASDLRPVLQVMPEAFWVEQSDDLVRNQRTGKTLPAVVIGGQPSTPDDLSQAR